MNGRFGAALVAFAAAAALVSHARVLPEFLVQLHDAAIAGGPLFQTVLHSLGFAFVLALCAVLAAGAILLSAWRLRTRGAPDRFATLTAVFAALCMLPRMGVSLDPIGWICAAGFMLLLERPGAAAAAGCLALTAIWSLFQGGAPLAALLAGLALAGALLESRSFDAAVRQKSAIFAGSAAIGILQLHGWPFPAYGAHALYLDALLPGAQRDTLFSTGISVRSLSFCALIVCAGWFGLRRRDRAADAFTFFVLMLLSIADARNLPYFGIVAAPIAVDAAASYYVHERTFPRGSVRQYAAAFLAASFAFAAAITATEPKVVIWPQPADAPAALLARLASDGAPHRVLCEQPRWCDGAHDAYANIRPLLDDRAGTAPAARRSAQADAVRSLKNWRAQLQAQHVDAVIADRRASIVALLVADGWRTEERKGTRVLLRAGRAE